MATLTASLALLLVGIAVVGQLIAVRQALLRQVAQDNEREARRTRHEAQTQTLTAYESLVGAHYNQSHALRNATQPGRQEQALAFLSRAAGLRQPMRELSANLAQEADSWQGRIEGFWAQQLPKLNNEAAYWLTETSLQRTALLSFPHRAEYQRLAAPAISADGRWLARHVPQQDSSRPYHVELIEVDSGLVRRTWELPQSDYVALAFSGVQQLLVARLTSSGSGRSRFGLRVESYAIPSGERVKSITPATPQGASLDFDTRRLLVPSPDGRRTLLTRDWVSVRGVWDNDNGRLVCEIPSRFAPIAFTPRGDQVCGLQLLDGNSPSVVAFLDLASRKLVKVLQSRLAIPPDGLAE